MHLQLILSRNKSSLNDGGIAAILNLAMSRGRPSTNQTFFAGETIIIPQNNRLAPSLNFFGVGLYCCEVLQSRGNNFKCQNQGKNNVKLKGNPAFHLLTLVGKSSLIIFFRLLE